MNFLGPRLPDRFRSKVAPEPNGEWTLTRLGERYGLKKSQVSNIVNRKAWAAP
jgi:hypothetical protein